jgi:hypothetical protein
MHPLPRPALLERLSQHGLDLSYVSPHGSTNKLGPVHLAAVAGLTAVLRQLASDVHRPLTSDSTIYAVTHGPVKIGRARPRYEEPYVALNLPAGATPLDIAQTVRQQVLGARKAWKANKHADAERKERADATLATWQADLDAAITMLHQLGASQGMPPPALPSDTGGRRRRTAM